MTKFNVIFSS